MQQAGRRSMSKSRDQTKAKSISSQLFHGAQWNVWLYNNRAAGLYSRPMTSTHNHIAQPRELGFGCMHLGKEDQATANAVLDTAVELGIRLFDHADIYRQGASEERFGDWLRARPALRDKILVQSKCGIRPPWDGNVSLGRYDFSGEHVIRSVENSLSRLRCGHLDQLLFHRPDPLMDVDELAETCTRLREQGKVRSFGVSNHSAPQMALMARVMGAPPVANQVQLNLIHNGMINDTVTVNRRGQPEYANAHGIMEYCQLHGVTIQAWAPLMRGYLGSRPLSEMATDPYANADDLPRLTAVRAVIDQLAAQHQVSPEAISLAWLLRHPARILPLVGTGKPDRLRQAAQAVTIRLAREEWYTLFVTARGAPVP
jgi:predicted oxidoreductase